MESPLSHTPSIRTSERSRMSICSALSDGQRRGIGWPLLGPADVALLRSSSGCSFAIEERHCARFPSDPVD
jgi:hypothetical protein